MKIATYALFPRIKGLLLTQVGHLVVRRLTLQAHTHAVGVDTTTQTCSGPVFHPGGIQKFIRMLGWAIRSYLRYTYTNGFIWRETLSYQMKDIGHSQASAVTPPTREVPSTLLPGGVWACFVPPH